MTLHICFYSAVKLNAQRQIEGVLRGSDHMMNLALEHAFDITEKDERKEIGSMILRGAAIVWIEAIDRL